jgi:hypothetical protein
MFVLTASCDVYVEVAQLVIQIGGTVRGEEKDEHRMSQELDDSRRQYVGHICAIWSYWRLIRGRVPSHVTRVAICLYDVPYAVSSDTNYALSCIASMNSGRSVALS